MTHRQIKETIDRAEQHFNKLEQLADQLQAATTNPQQFQEVARLSSQITQEMQEIQRYVNQAQQGQQ